MTISRKKLSAIAVAALTLLSLLVATPAQADDSSELSGCWTTLWGVGPNFHWSTGSGGSTGVADHYSYSPLGQVPSSPNGCEDINVDNGYDGNAGYYRVRFYPSSGGNYANSWKPASCAQSWCYVAAATNVVNGTWFRIEWYYLPGGSDYAWGDHRFNIWI